MTWEPVEGELRRLQALPVADRALQLVQLAVDWEELWGLTDAHGWVVGQATDALPLWPHPDLARACAQGPWEGAEPAAIPLDELLADLLPQLEAESLGTALFPVPGDPGLLLTPEELRRRLGEELELGV